MYSNSSSTQPQHTVSRYMVIPVPVCGVLDPRSPCTYADLETQPTTLALVYCVDPVEKPARQLQKVLSACLTLVLCFVPSCAAHRVSPPASAAMTWSVVCGRGGWMSSHPLSPSCSAGTVLCWWWQQRWVLLTVRVAGVLSVTCVPTEQTSALTPTAVAHHLCACHTALIHSSVADIRYAGDCFYIVAGSTPFLIFFRQIDPPAWFGGAHGEDFQTCIATHSPCGWHPLGFNPAGVHTI
jgi:hypothetical protein